MQGTMAVVTCFAADFAPKYWALCNGQILSIAQNQALFSLLGTTYGGNGTTTFALPDLRGRTVVSQGAGPGLANYSLGQKAGAETTTLIASNIPSHQHVGPSNFYLQADNLPGGDGSAEYNFPANFNNAYAPNPTASVNMLEPAYTGVINPIGAQPLPILMSYLAINYIICMQGIFPSRN